MLKPTTVSILFIILLGATKVSLAQADFWERTGSPKTISARVVTIKSPDTIFAGTSTDLLRSTDAGESWETTTIKNMINDILITPNGDIFVGAYSVLYRSRDGGMSWDFICRDLRPKALAVHPNGNIFAIADSVVAYGQLYRSTDAGYHWTPQIAGPWSTIAINDSGQILVGGSGIQRSIDDGATWTTILKDIHVVHLAINARGHIFAGAHPSGFLPGGLFRSTDNGITWDSVSTGLTDRYVNHVEIMNGDTIFVNVGKAPVAGQVPTGRIFGSVNNGASWAPTGLQDFLNKGTALAACPGGLVFAGSEVLYRSRDAGENWSRLGGVWDFSVKQFCLSKGDTLYAGLNYSTDFGCNWQRLELGSNWGGGGVIAVNSRGHLFVSTWNEQRKTQWLRSTDHGKQWVPIWTPSWPNGYILSGALFINNIDQMFIGNELGVHRSTDNGDSWWMVYRGAYDAHTGTERTYALAIDSLDHVYIVTSRRGVFRSTDNCASWDTSGGGLKDYMITRFAAGAHGGIFAADYGSPSMIFRSTDDGTSWVHLYTLPDVNAMVANANGDLFVATRTMGVFQNGVPVNGGLMNLLVYALAVDSRGYLVASTGSGFFRSVRSTTSIERESDPLPVVVHLGQNYPNPFNPSTTIRYALPHRSHVTVTVFNTLGQQIATLVNGDMEAGYHEVQFDGSNLASGIYFYRLQVRSSNPAKGGTGSFVDTKKLLLIR